MRWGWQTHGYATRGQRCFGIHDWHAKGRINVIGALLTGVLLTVGLTSSKVDADIFYLWPEHDLIPKLRSGAVLVMDNATFHKRADAGTMIQAKGHIPEYLPSYTRVFPAIRCLRFMG